MIEPAPVTDEEISMGLEDRDWFREEPSRAWQTRWSTPDAPRHDVRCGSSATPEAGGVSVRPGAWLAIAVSAVAIGLTWQLHLLRVPLHVPGSTAAPASAPAEQAAAPEIRITPTPAMLIRSSQPATWSISDPNVGTISVLVPAGSVPLDTIVNELSARGYHVLLPADLGAGLPPA